jgi:thioredoxin-related protein
MQILKLITLLAFLGITLACQAQNQETTDGIKWYSFEEAVALAGKEPKNIFIDFYTTWCGWCKVMDKNTFADPIISKIMNQYFYPVKFNAEGKDPVNFQGKEYKFVAQGTRGYHELAAAIMQGQMSYPTFVFLTPTMEIITPIAGYVKPEDFEPIAIYMGQNLYKPEKNIPWENFRDSYKSQRPK